MANITRKYERRVEELTKKTLLKQEEVNNFGEMIGEQWENIYQLGETLGMQLSGKFVSTYPLQLFISLLL